MFILLIKLTLLTHIQDVPHFSVQTLPSNAYPIDRLSRGIFMSFT